MALAVATGLFLIFVINVGLGSMTGSPILGDVWEMLVLLAASIAFVAGILQRESRAKDQDNPKTD